MDKDGVKEKHCETSSSVWDHFDEKAEQENRKDLSEERFLSRSVSKTTTWKSVLPTLQIKLQSLKLNFIYPSLYFKQTSFVFSQVQILKIVFLFKRSVLLNL